MPLHNYTSTVSGRLQRYVRIDTQSDPTSGSIPSTAKQKNLARILVNELTEMGIPDALMDEFGYVYATLPSNTNKAVPIICYCAHLDTSPDCSGTNVNPLIHYNYDGSDIILPDDPRIILKKSEHPDLAHQTGNDIITASGTTLLGADNKAGIAAIMDAVNHLVKNPGIKHGAIRILFTPDEEIGRGADKVDIEKLGAVYGYTIDGETAGSIEDETFSADGMVLRIYGVSAHPGFAKDKLVNAMKIAGEILYKLPKNQLSPESTEGREGFVHPVSMKGVAEEASITFIIRDFSESGLESHEKELQQIAEQVIAQYPEARLEVEIKEQYRNMKKVLDQHPQVVAFAEKSNCTNRTASKKAQYQRGNRRLTFVIYGSSLSKYLCW